MDNQDKDIVPSVVYTREGINNKIKYIVYCQVKKLFNILFSESYYTGYGQMEFIRVFSNLKTFLELNEYVTDEIRSELLDYLRVVDTIFCKHSTLKLEFYLIKKKIEMTCEKN